MTVVDRYVVTMPNDTSGWLDQLDALTSQIQRGQLDPSLIGAALDLARAAVVDREQLQDRYRR